MAADRPVLLSHNSATIRSAAQQAASNKEQRR
jgi:hypothetical protein